MVFNIIHIAIMLAPRKYVPKAINSESSTESILSLTNSYHLISSIRSPSVEEVSVIGINNSKSNSYLNDSSLNPEKKDLIFKNCSCVLF